MWYNGDNFLYIFLFYHLTPPSAVPDFALLVLMNWHSVSWIDASHHDLKSYDFMNWIAVNPNAPQGNSWRSQFMKLCFKSCRPRQFIASVARVQHVFNENSIPLVSRRSASRVRTKQGTPKVFAPPVKYGWGFAMQSSENLLNFSESPTAEG